MPRGGRYRVIRRIGVGATAEVFEATRHDGGAGVPVVLKKILPQRSGDPRFRALFTEEAKTIRRLAHPNVVALRDFGELDGSLFLELEPVPGRDLRSLLAAGRPPIDVAIAIGADVAGALAYVHGEGVAHRDVSPDNVLISNAGIVKLTDFGIAHRDGAGEGKPPYAAPEPTASGPERDVYALGVMVAEMLDGRLTIEIVERARSADARDRPAAGEIERALRDQIAPVAPDVAAFVARAAPSDPRGADALASHLLGGGDLRPSTAIVATPRRPSFEEPRTELVAPPAKERTAVSIPVLIGAVAITAITSSVATWAVTAEREAEPYHAPEFAFEDEPAPPDDEPPARDPPDVRATDGRKLRPASRSTSKYGTLTVDSVPWANVFVDGELLGPTPLTKAIRSGRRRIVLRSGSGEVLERTIVDVEAGRAHHVSVGAAER
jgi:serine/threonine protein kinase